MSTFGVVKSIIESAILILSGLLAIRLLFANEERREIWRSFVKRRIYFSRKWFRKVTILLGWVLLFIAIYLAYLQIDKLVAKG